MSARKSLIHRDQGDIHDKGLALAVKFNRIVIESYASGQVSVADIVVACGSLIAGYVGQVPKRHRADFIAEVVQMISEETTSQ